MNHSDLLGLLLPPVSYAPRLARMAATLAAEGNALDRAYASALQVALAITPYDVQQLLPDWERVYGLPDACCGATSSWQQRFNALIGKIVERGGLSSPYYVQRLAAQGYAITINEFHAATCVDDCGVGLYQDETGWQYAFEVVSQNNAVQLTTCGDTCGDPLATWGNSAIECLINRLKPSHTIPIFSYV